MTRESLFAPPRLYGRRLTHAARRLDFVEIAQRQLAETIYNELIMTSSATHISLLERARMHDQQAWSELVTLYSPLLAGWCKRMGLGPEATADCLQDVFASVYRGLDLYSPPGTSGAFRGWLWTITRNKLRDRIRRRRDWPAASGGTTAHLQLNTLADVCMDQICSEEPSSADDERLLMRRALGQIESSFNESTWKAFWRTVVDGLSTDVVCSELGMSPASIRQARSRVMRRLRQQLGDL